MDRNRFSLHGNELASSSARKVAQWLPMVVFIMAQRYFVENVATSGIK